MLQQKKIVGKQLNLRQMKRIKGGWDSGEKYCLIGKCSYYESAAAGYVNGSCEQNRGGQCICNAGSSSVPSTQCVVYTDMGVAGIEV